MGRGCKARAPSQAARREPPRPGSRAPRQCPGHDRPARSTSTPPPIRPTGRTRSSSRFTSPLHHPAAGTHNRSGRTGTVRWLNLLLDAVFPVDCEVCGAPLPLGRGPGVCVPCHDAMRPPPDPLCPRCGMPLGMSDAPAACPACLRHPPAFATARAAALYLSADGGLNPLAAAVRAFKYRRRRNLAPTLGGLLAERYPFGPDALLVPVPLHRS